MKKRLLCTILIMVIMFGATVPSFASPTQWDTSDQTNLRNAQSYLYNIWNWVNNYAPTFNGQSLINQNLSNINNKLGGFTSSVTLYDALVSIDNHLNSLENNIIGSSGTSIGSKLSTISSTLGNIWSALSFAVDGQYISAFVARIMTAVESFDTDLSALNKALTRQTTLDRYNNAQSWLVGADGTYSYSYVDSNFNQQTVKVPWTNGSPIGNLAYIMNNFNDSFVRSSVLNHRHFLTGYNSNQNVVNWGSLDTSTFTPSSAIDGIYKYLNTIQAPVARLAYVLANEQEISARDKAQANQTAVVDNFIDPNGSGSVSTSNFGDIASASDSFKDNMNTGVSASGIFDVFNGDHTSEWFSTETANELNNVGSGRRSLKASSPQPTYETPLLDAKMTELLGIFGGDGE